MSGHKSTKKGSNIICRVSNVTPEMVCSYVKRMPKQKMKEDAFRDIMGKSWFQNEHQAPEQWGLYYIDGTYYYPRFDHDITIGEAEAYLYHWMRNLIVINPYTRFKKQCNKNLVESIVGQLEKNPNEHDLKTIVGKIIDSDEPFVINEIIANALNNYSRVIKVETINKDNEQFNVSLIPNYKEILKAQYNMTKKEYFELFDSVKTAFDPNAPIQQIFYGCPGTGKSYTVKKQTAGESVVRTTFHPDSDYSTFVGCYKPSMGGGLKDVISTIELKKKLFDIKLKGEPYPCQKFGAQYWNSLANLSQADVKDILTACGFTESMYTEIGKGISVGREMYSNTESCIVYEFVEQAFLKAYVKAWKFYAETENNAEPKKQYLIIEEINRGNCAQIFGDLFQLLDRNSAGFSDYSIHADKDMRRFLEKEFSGLVIDEASKEYVNAMYNDDEKDVVSKVLSGEILLLPSNLYIWATMNTSDQSLFPIDSAFKRRWDWVYEPIKYKNTDWVIEVKDKTYSWVSFQKIINKKIFEANSSEDKMLGDYFVNPGNGVITEKILLNKIMFYLWNDVCKEGEGDIFMVSETEDVTFSELHGEGGSEKLVAMMKYLGVSSVNNTAEDDLNEEPIDQESKTWYQNLWADVRNNLSNKGLENVPAPRERQTYQLSVGLTGISVLANLPRTKASGYVGYYIEKQQASDIYPKLLTLKEAIEDKLGVLDWLREGDRYAVVKRNLDTSGINNDGLRSEIVENVSTLLVDFKDAILPLIDQLR